MRQIVTNVYQYDELTDAAKSKARDWYRETATDDFSTFGAEFTISDFVKVASFCGWTVYSQTCRTMRGTTLQKPCVYWSGFWSQGDGACFEGSFSARNVNVAALKAYAPEDTELHAIADEIAPLAAVHPDASATVKHRGHYYHDGCTEFDVDDSLTVLANQVIRETARALMRWLYRALEKEFEYQNADEQVAETIRANEYEFTSEGKHA